MTAHELARELLESEDFELEASIDISTGDNDSDRRIFATNCRGVNSSSGDGGVITLLFDADPKDNYGKKI